MGVFKLFLSKLFVCRTEFAGGVWAGVELDTHQGKNDGAVKGRRNIISFHSKLTIVNPIMQLGKNHRSQIYLYKEVKMRDK